MDAIVLHTGLAHNDGDWNWTDVRSPFARIYYVVDGRAEIVFSNHTVSLSAGHLYLVPPFVRHSNRCKGKFTHYYAHIYEPVDAVSGLFEDYRFPDEVAAKDIDASLFERLCQINSEKCLVQPDPKNYDNPASLLQSVAEGRTSRLSVRMESNGIINQLLSRFIDNAEPLAFVHDKRMRRVLKHIRRNLYRSITLDSLADMTSLSKDHFIRLFKNECGESPLQYINHRKVELAETMLVTTEQSIKQISFNLGFSDFSYFTRLFRKTTGTTPALYRKTSNAM